MRVLALTTFLASFIGSFSWEVDPRCPEPPRRRLSDPGTSPKDDVVDDGVSLERELEELLVEKSNSLRGHEERDVEYLTERQLQSDSRRFNMKMYWPGVGTCWQEEWDIHRKWCMQCEGSSCGENDILYLQECRNIDEQEFQWLGEDGEDSSVGRLKTAGKDLCLTKISTNYYKLKRCSNSRSQLLKGFKRDAPFELMPIGDSSKCLNQHHHPKAYEEIYTTTCKLARIYSTNKWQTYYEKEGRISDTGSGPGLKERNPQCSENRPCGRCEGDCDSDDECKGNLKCYQRRSSNPWDIVFGCSGWGRKGFDYCYDPGSDLSGGGGSSSNNNENNSGGSSNNGGTRSSTVLDRNIKNCSRDNPCGQCQGDCDSNRDCAGDLVCFQKSGKKPVPGCSGSDSSRTDFCIDPKDQ